MMSHLRSTDWLFNGIAEAFNNNTARMAITGDDPMLLSEFNQDKISRLNKATSKSYKPAREKLLNLKLIGALFRGLSHLGQKSFS